MSTTTPDLADYVHLFQTYGNDLGDLYQEPEDDRYALLFEQVTRLLVKPSPFNLTLAEPFRISAHRYLDGDPITVRHLKDPANRHFMLCDLHDWIMLRGGLALKRAQAKQAGR
ncbi:hypothetical protein [Rhodospirillum sp. A1_3_36]|uniref:hypothetical protein n=1 Tax=Rhodospirillum sp. A1_3_36 TaxID=3391666 RepID=UPI0039A58788